VTRVSGGAGPRRLGVVAPVVAAVMSALLAAGCLPASATDVRVAHRLFGVHDASLLASTRVHEGSVRLWDVGVQWRDVEKTKGHYTWTRLDQLVRAAQAAHQEVTMVVAMTPRFYSADPTSPPGRLSRYSDFVRAMMKRYHHFGPDNARGIAAYEVWNEVNIHTFWTGSMRQMVRLSQLMYRVRNNVDPRAKVIAPPMVTGRTYQLTWMKKFFAQRLNGTPVARFYDAIGLSLYPFARASGRTGTPEDSMGQLRQVRRLLRADHVSPRKPIWNTEVNYGAQTAELAGTAAYQISNGRQAAFVARTYLLNAAAGIRRVFWYRYDMGPMKGGTLMNTLLSKPGDPSAITPSGRAFRRVQAWMHGRLVGVHGHRPCAKDRNGTYTCVAKDSTGTRRIYWNPDHTAKVRLAANAHHKTGVLGGVDKVRPRSVIRVGQKPVMAGR
jgi:polysaccharide biosynthesis protein PslG